MIDVKRMMKEMTLLGLVTLTCFSLTTYLVVKSSIQHVEQSEQKGN